MQNRPEEVREQSIRDVLFNVRDATLPDFSLPFIAGFLLITIFHESHATFSGCILIAWILVQLVSHVIDEDFYSNLFWNAFGLIGNIFFYLFIGYCWSMAKLYIDIWQGHLPAPLIKDIQTCFSTAGTQGCGTVLLSKLKWNVVFWITNWPFSLAYTLARDPLKIATDTIYAFGQKRYISIIKAALETESGTHSSSPLYLLFTWSAMISGYILMGWLWSHAKLFFDVWQGTLPNVYKRELDEIRQDEQRLWTFIVRIKRLVVAWNVLWPFSIVYTLLRHPLRLLADLLYALSIRSYMWAARKGLSMKQQ